jgi:predicted transcriptional regulator
LTLDNGAFCELLFEASNEDRLRIIEVLAEKPMKLTTLSKKTGISTQEMSRHVTRLTTSGITERDLEGLYHITPYGRLIISQFSGLRFTTANRHYLNDHPLNRLPSSFIQRLGDLADSKYLEDAILVFDNVERMIKESEEYVYRITDRYLTSWLPVIDEALRRGVDYRLLSPENIVVSKGFRLGPIMTKAELKGQFKVRSVEGPDVFLAMSEKEVAALGFPNSKGKMDYYSFSSMDPAFHGWCLDLFNFYWGKSIPKPSESLSKWGTFEKDS